jgi:adenosine deaminase
MARASLEHSFLPGSSIWREQDVFTRVVASCAADSPGTENPSSACAAFLKANEKAQQQWDLERRFGRFESNF